MLLNVKKVVTCALLVVGHVLALHSPLPESRTLVLYDAKVSPDFETQHSQLLQLLSERGLQPVVEAVNSDKTQPIELYRNGFRLFQNVIVFPSKAKTLSTEISYKTLEQFSQDGGSVLVISDNTGTQSDLALYLNELGIYPSPNGYKLIDYHGSSSESGVVESIDSPNFLNSIVVPTAAEKLQYSKGAAALLSNSEFLIPLLRAPKTSVTYNLDEGAIGTDSTWHSGSQGFLFVGFQGLNNARTLWTGSSSVFEDSSFDKDLVSGLINWTFQITGLIKTTAVNHYKIVDGSVANDTNYKIKDTTRYEIALSTWSGEQWVPFTNCSDLQLEFIMLDPYYRLTLESLGKTQDAEIYGTTFQIPDHHGMFTYKVEYQREGYSFVDESVVVAVRHLANDEYPRSWEITNSWVYLAGTFSVIVGWFAFVVLFVYSGKKEIASEEKKTN